MNKSLGRDSWGGTRRCLSAAGSVRASSLIWSKRTDWISICGHRSKLARTVAQQARQDARPTRREQADLRAVRLCLAWALLVSNSQAQVSFFKLGSTQSIDCDGNKQN